MPGYFALDVNGNLRVSDGYGIFTMSNSGTNCVATISNTAGYQENSTATLQVTGGYFSSNGTTGSMTSGGTSNIGVWKKGIVMVSAQDTANSTNFTTELAMVCLTGTTYTVTAMSSIDSNATITASTSNIVLTNNGGASRIYTYSITYFPMP